MNGTNSITRINLLRPPLGQNEGPRVYVCVLHPNGLDIIRNSHAVNLWAFRVKQSCFSLFCVGFVVLTELNKNKKVLLRECKRHTARRVGSARYAALSSGWGGTPSQGGTPARSWWWGGTPSWVGCTSSQVWRVPQSGLGGGVPHPGVGGTPARSWWWGGTPARSWW